MREADLESWFAKRVKKTGGRSYKWVSPGNSGVPDRIVLLKGGRTVYVELKTEKGKLSDLQRFQIRHLEELGADVRVLYGKADCEKFIEEAETWNLSHINIKSTV